MSFSLVVTSPVAITKAQSKKEAEAIQQLDGANWVEIMPADSKSTVVSHLSFHHKTAPSDVKQFFTNLVNWTKTRGFGILDMQSGQTIDLDNPRDISVEFLPQPYKHQPCMMSRGKDWEIVVGKCGVVGSLRPTANGDIRLVFGDDEDTAISVDWLLEKIAWLRG